MMRGLPHIGPRSSRSLARLSWNENSQCGNRTGLVSTTPVAKLKEIDISRTFCGVYPMSPYYMSWARLRRSNKCFLDVKICES